MSGGHLVQYMSGGYMVHVWCICGTCLADVWWELTRHLTGIGQLSGDYLTGSTRQLATVWRKWWSMSQVNYWPRNGQTDTTKNIISLLHLATWSITNWVFLLTRTLLCQAILIMFINQNNAGLPRSMHRSISIKIMELILKTSQC